MKRGLTGGVLAVVALSAVALWWRAAPGSVAVGLLAGAAAAAFSQTLLSRAMRASWNRFAAAFCTAFGGHLFLFFLLSILAHVTPLSAIPLLATYGAAVFGATLAIGIGLPVGPVPPTGEHA